MELLIQFFANYGLAVGLIALAGVIALGILKYCNVFEKIGSDTTRHIIYCVCSVGLTLIGIIIYLLCTHGWDWTFFITLVPVIWALNQAMYNLFKVTKINDLFVMIFDILKKVLSTEKTKEEK